MKEKAIMFIMTVCGVSATVYGMIQKDNIVFISGLMLVVVAYLIFRRRLKEAIKKREERERRS